MASKPTGSLVGFDLTVPDATGIRDFYAAVFGWESQGLDMGGYEDYVMTTPGNDDAGFGICHARGVNADQPSGWIAYVTVGDLQTAIETVRANGGEPITPVKGDPGSWQFCVIRDPAGARIALMQPGD